MTFNLKRLSLLVGALIALGGLMASGTSAHTPAKFTFEEDTTTITAEGVEGGGVPKVTGREIACSTERFHGHVETPEDDTSATGITLTPTYTGCTAFGFANAKVTGFGHYGESETCDYLLNADGTLDLVCADGTDVTIEVGTTCITHIPEQTNLGTITYTTEFKQTAPYVKHDLGVHVNLAGITVTHTDLNFLCPFSGSGEISNATLEGKWTMWGEGAVTGILLGITWDETE